MSASIQSVRNACAELRHSEALCSCFLKPCQSAVVHALGEAPAGFVAVLDDGYSWPKLYGAGRTKDNALGQAIQQLAGADQRTRRDIYSRLQLQPCTAAHLSDIAELLEADVLQWL